MKTKNHILQFLKPHYKWALLSPILVGIEVIAELLQPHYMAEIVNDGIIAGQNELIIPLAVRMLGISLLGMISGVLSIFAAGYVSYNFGADMRHALFEQITHFSFKNIDKLKTGSLITRITGDVFKLQSVIQSSMRLLFRSPFLFVGSIFMVLSISTKLSVVLLIILPILLFSVTTIVRRAYPLFLKIQEKTDRLNTVIQESLAGVRVVKAYTQENKELTRFKEANNDLIENNLRVSKLIVLLGPVMSFTLNIGIAAIVYYGAVLMNQRESINVGEIMAITNYLTQLLMSLMMAQRIIMSITEAQASLSRINEVLNTERSSDISSFTPTTNETPNIVEFKHVSFRYNEGNVDSEHNYVLHDLSFSIKHGETIGIIGATGSGKTTLALLLLRCYLANKGEIRLNDIPIENFDTETLHRTVGLAMQQIQLFSGTIAENLRWGNSAASDDELMDACRTARISDFIESQKEGLDYPIKQGGVNLSGGQKQRLSLARTLVGTPSLLILDDCLNAVDMKTEAALTLSLKSIHSTKIIISQRISTIKDADRILILEKGEIVGEGTHEQLLHNNSIYQEICRSQLD